MASDASARDLGCVLVWLLGDYDTSVIIMRNLLTTIKVGSSCFQWLVSLLSIETGGKATKKTHNVKELGAKETVPSLAVIQQMIQAAAAAAFQEREATSPKRPVWRLWPLLNLIQRRMKEKGRYVKGQELELKEVLQYIMNNIEFPGLVAQEESEDIFFQYQRKEPESLPLHSSVKKVIENEQKEDEKHTFPIFLAKR
ncbi:hypothetical protein NDU88_005409 [Pleurodeles waltl]|uniref:Uncharacterized protein n=1 Tax=Pleurodeles waltl TaxID=8319 RepID=A0AAV7MZ71_PLEWA|nr:hypothetical protein NDU88_005409 [Pleurodeles waltl]